MNTVLRPKSHFLQPLCTPGWFAASLGVAALGGCSPAEPASPGVVQQKIVESQGMSLQGMSLQGMSLQGMSLQGISLQGMSLQGISLQGISLQGTSLQGVPLGSAIDVATDQQTVSLRIDQIESDPQDAAGEIQLYTVSVWDAAGQTWQNLCDATPSGEQKAIPVSGYWDQTGAHVADPARFTLACTSGVIAKCMRWGYKPWKTVNGESLAPYHQACTRMARADYCGDGVSHTQNGTLIDMYDILGIQTRTEGINMYFEAAWTPEGAYCISKERWRGLDTYDKSSGRCYSSIDAVLLPLDPDDTDRCYVKLPARDKKRIFLRNRSYVNTVGTLPSF